MVCAYPTGVKRDHVARWKNCFCRTDSLSGGAIRCKARRHRWHLRQPWQRAICNLQNLKEAREFESHSLRHNKINNLPRSACSQRAMACWTVTAEARMPLKLYRRHRLECEARHSEDSRSGEWEESRRGWKRCNCGIHISGT